MNDLRVINTVSLRSVHGVCVCVCVRDEREREEATNSGHSLSYIWTSPGNGAVKDFFFSVFHQSWGSGNVWN